MSARTADDWPFGPLKPLSYDLAMVEAGKFDPVVSLQAPAEAA